MSGPDRAALVERMCVLVATAWDNEQRMQDGMSAALDLALEEAAKVAKSFPARTHGNLAIAPERVAEQVADEIATAISALKSTA